MVSSRVCSSEIIYKLIITYRCILVKNQCLVLVLCSIIHASIDRHVLFPNFPAGHMIVQLLLYCMLVTGFDMLQPVGVSGCNIGTDGLKW